ncbi:SRPBCC family protein [Sphingosinicella microcystinivorans]|uniref:Polyketide cyclase/dehydrase/lipid transport protein n=1 Tax=Sphingosinicella microcystinivorans TaxID=335406 RepID=A0AAD1D2S7_SPHMI|nr:SRPBCC family protein [Sphingosinicella microcystinivorans]RKS88639.1 polyketide cyclase/dehydrase/lipid transport protein [Sphingosinicella microcystinivorans]BBE32387.1 hypothetical protein SmB9_00450 [Sphingosinicella microcystinivorans]
MRFRSLIAATALASLAIMLAGPTFAAKPAPIAAETAAATFNRIDLQIDAPCEIVWSYVIDRSKWKDNFVSRTILEPGPVGELAEYKARLGGQVMARMERTVAYAPNRRLVYLIAADETYTFAAYELTPNSRGCTLQLSISLVSPTHLFSEKSLREAVARETQGLIESDHSKVKALAEQDTSRKSRTSK